MIAVRDEVINEERGYLQRITTFQTEASTTEVESYYKAVMVQNGWWFDDSPHAGGSEMPGLYFYYFRGNVEKGNGGSASVLAKGQPGGITNVEIRTRGSDLNQ
jgi:hypothetical protein